MSNIKPKILPVHRSLGAGENLKSKEGFTLIELMAVVAIMAIMATLLVINLAGQRAPRDVKIAQNQLVSYIREAQSYTLSDRVLPNGQAVQFYILKFDLSKPTQYTLEAIYNVSTSPQLVDIQTVSLPANIQIAAISSSAYPIVIDRSPTNDTYYTSGGTQTLSQTIAPGTGCALIAFAAPFGKPIFSGGCSTDNNVWEPNNNDYEKIVNFETSVICASYNNPPPCTASSDSIMTITLSDSGKTISKTVMVNAVTGAVTFN